MLAGITALVASQKAKKTKSVLRITRVTVQSFLPSRKIEKFFPNVLQRLCRFVAGSLAFASNLFFPLHLMQSDANGGGSR